MSVAVALAHAAERGEERPIDAVTAAVCLPTLADSAPAPTGALAGAAHELNALPMTWVERCRRLAGCCAPDLAGLDLVELARLHRGKDDLLTSDALIDTAVGCLTGAAVGDALGGATGSWSPQQIRERWGGWVEGIVPPTRTGALPGPSRRTTRATDTSPTTPS